MTITKTDPRHEAALRALDAMHEYWKLAPHRGAVQWIEDADGRLVVFSRGEYRSQILEGIEATYQPIQFFEIEGDE